MRDYPEQISDWLVDKSVRDCLDYIEEALPTEGDTTS